MGTATLILKALETYDLQPKRDGYYTSNSPLRPGSNSHAFQVHIIDEEHGGYIDFARPGEETAKGSLYDLAKRMDIPLPDRGHAQVTKRVYTGLKDYAAAHYVAAEVFTAAGWTECTYINRLALRIPTSGGIRYRFLDGNDNFRWCFEKGGKPSWYGFKKALPLAAETGMPLIFCNGEPSVVVAQSYGLTAVTVTSGEKDSIKPELLAQLVKEYPPADDHEIIVAMDCDKTGRLAAPGLVRQLLASGYRAHAVDLMLTDGGDLADFCGLHQESAYADFLKLPELKVEAQVALATPSAPAARPSLLVSWNEASKRASAGYYEHIDPRNGKPLPIPFKQISQFGGMAELVEPGNVFCIAAPTGHAKTSLIEAIIDPWRRDMGASGAMWGPEFTPEFYVYRAIQRAGGPPANQVRWHQLALRGMTDHSGLSRAEIEQSEQIRADIDGWKGSLTFIDRLGITFEEVIEQYKLAIQQGPLHFAVLDYAQLILGEKSAASVEANLALFKGLCKDNHLVGIVGSQVTKAGSSAGGWIDMEDLRYMNGDYFNCIVTVCRQPDTTGKFLPEAKIAVVKNSLGSCGRGTLLLHPKTMLWQDPVIYNVNLEKATMTQVPM